MGTQAGRRRKSRGRGSSRPGIRCTPDDKGWSKPSPTTKLALYLMWSEDGSKEGRQLVLCRARLDLRWPEQSLQKGFGIGWGGHGEEDQAADDRGLHLLPS